MVNITDETGEPSQGNFSVSVTDDHVVIADTALNIMTSLLLTSDLRGNIPDPAYYFRKTGQSSVYALDMLMLTQGWRRYDTEQIVKNNLIYPDTILSKGYELSGMLRTVLGWKPVENANVSILSLTGDFADDTCTDRNGRFYLQDGGANDSTIFVVQTNRQEVELLLDEASYPGRTIPVVDSGIPDRIQFALYADKEEQRYVSEHGFRIYHLDEVVITAPRNYSKHYFAKDAIHSITETYLERFPAANMKFLLGRMGISFDTKIISGEVICEICYGLSEVIPVVDDHIVDKNFVLSELTHDDIAQIDLVPGSFAGIFSADPRTFVLFINHKFSSKSTPYLKYIMPLGIQRPAEFYAPKYDTPAQHTNPDLRTTIHWEPNITTDENGTASFSFFTADEPSTYSVVIEGVTENGKIVYKRDKISLISK